MSADMKSGFVEVTKINRRILVRRTLIAALIALCAAIAYSFFVVIQFHLHIAAFQKQNAGLMAAYPNAQGELAQTNYGPAPGPFFIPNSIRQYHHSLYSIYLSARPNSNPEEMDELFRLFTYFPKLQELMLEGLSINEERANAIARLPQLKTLVFKRCRFEKTSLASLLKKDGLTHLSLADSEFPEAELEILNQGPAKETLVGLSLSQCHVTDQSASILSRCRNLEFLELDGTQITDQGLKQLARLPQLRVLILDHTSVTDYGVGYLSSTQNLVELSISNTSASDAMLETLKKEIPALLVSDD